jgi:hypothetical protein
MFFIEFFLESIGRSGVFPMREHARYTGECGGNQPKKAAGRFSGSLFPNLTSDVGVS